MVMKRLLRKALVSATGIFMAVSPAMAYGGKPVTVDQLPAEARRVIKENFQGNGVAMVKTDMHFLSRNYDVVFNNGDKIEFDRNGNWTEVSSKDAKVPDKMVPVAVRTYVRTHYPKTSIRGMEKKRNKYEVELSNGLEITFNRDFMVIDIDD